MFLSQKSKRFISCPSSCYRMFSGAEDSFWPSVYIIVWIFIDLVPQLFESFLGVILSVEVFFSCFFSFYERAIWKSCIIFSSWEKDSGCSCTLAAREFLIYYQSSVLVLAHSDILILARLLAFSSLYNKSGFMFAVQLISARTVMIHCHRS